MTKKIHLLTLVLPVLLLLPGLSAATTVTDQTPTEVTKPKPYKKPRTSLVVYEVQTFPLGDTMQMDQVFRAGDLYRIRIRNKGKPVEMTVFSQQYQLGTDDEIEMDPPNLTQFSITVVPLTKHSQVSSGMAKPHARTFVVDMPAQENNTTQH